MMLWYSRQPYQECGFNRLNCRKAQDFHIEPIAPRGFEPLKPNPQTPINKTLTDNEKSVLATSLDILVQKYPDLAELVKLWPEITEDTKKVIKAIIETHIVKHSKT